MIRPRPLLYGSAEKHGRRYRGLACPASGFGYDAHLSLSLSLSEGDRGGEPLGLGVSACFACGCRRWVPAVAELTGFAWEKVMRQKGVREKGGLMASFLTQCFPVGWKDPWMYFTLFSY